MPLDLAALTDLTTRNESVEASAATLLQTLFDEVQANLNDPAALQALVDRGKLATDALATAIANTSGGPV